jgi:hypothetical protein
MSRAKGFDCEHCQMRHEFGAYAAENWERKVIHVCDCGARHDVLRGKASMFLRGRHEDAK